AHRGAGADFIKVGGVEEEFHGCVCSDGSVAWRLITLFHILSDWRRLARRDETTNLETPNEPRGFSPRGAGMSVVCKQSGGLRRCFRALCGYAWHAVSTLPWRVLKQPLIPPARRFRPAPFRGLRVKVVRRR